MERKLIKALLYSLFLAVLVGIIYFPDTQKLITGSGSYTMRELSLREYIFIVLRFAIKISLVTLAITWLWELIKTPEAEGTRFTKGLIKSFLIVFFLCIVIFIIIMNW